MIDADDSNESHGLTNHRRSRYLESIEDAIQPGLAETHRGSVGWHSEGAERSEAPRCDPQYT